MKKLILIKLGGSVITDKSKEFTSRKDNILKLAKEIKSAQKEFKGKIIVGHGAGSFAHTPASKYGTKKGLINKNSLIGAAIVEDAARKLNMIVVENFLEQGIPAFPFSPASFLISDTQIYIKSYLDPIRKALANNLFPIVYGDVVMDSKIGVTIFSTEKVLSVLAKELRNEYKIKMIYCTDVDGVYNMDGKTIPIISRNNYSQIKKSVSGAKGIDVTGGMLHKVEEGLFLAKKYGIETIVVNGNKKNNLRLAIMGKKVQGTLITN